MTTAYRIYVPIISLITKDELVRIYHTTPGFRCHVVYGFGVHSYLRCQDLESRYRVRYGSGYSGRRPSSSQSKISSSLVHSVTERCPSPGVYWLLTSPHLDRVLLSLERAICSRTAFLVFTICTGRAGEYSMKIRSIQVLWCSVVV